MKISRSTMLATGLLAGAVIWMLTGMVGNGSTPLQTEENAQQGGRQAMTVTVLESRAERVTREIDISARTQPNRSVDVAAETAGRVTAIEAERGARVREGDVIVSLDMRDRAARAKEAEALMKQRELEFQAAQRLRGREFMSESQIAEAEARLESARAALATIRVDIQRTTIAAPFDGMIEERAVELGDFVNVGDTIATLVDIDPLIVAGDVSERDIHALDPGSKGEARLLSGETVTGTLRYVSPVADAGTRTFRVELSIPNPEGALRAGMSAQVRLPAGEIQAHHMTPALLTLNDAGNVGVKTVNAQNRVEFHPVEIALSDQDGVWVTGLPERVTVITVGQGFVAAGETVRPVPAEESLQVYETGRADALAD